MVPDTWFPDPSKPTILYLHGIGQTRGHTHRVCLYNVLLAAGYPVLAVDYRGFGDSTEIEDIHEETVVEDAARAFQYLRESLGAARILVWGHSQGAAIATHMLAEQGENLGQVKLFLDAPYNTMRDQISSTRKWYERMVLRVVGLKKMDMQFRTTHWLPRVRCPVLITHAADDPKIPAKLSQDLFQKTRESKSDISRVQFDSGFGFGHSYTHRYQGLMEIVAKFWSGNLGHVSETVLYTE